MLHICSMSFLATLTTEGWCKVNHHFPLLSSRQPTFPDKHLPPVIADRIDHREMTHFPFHPLQTHNEVLIVCLCFTSAQSHSWPHWPQGDGVNVFVTFLCCHLGKPHTPHYLMSTCLLSLLTTLTTKKWHIFVWSPASPHKGYHLKLHIFSK